MCSVDKPMKFFQPRPCLQKYHAIKFDVRAQGNMTCTYVFCDERTELWAATTLDCWFEWQSWQERTDVRD